jgi:hypothetical protein
MNITILSFDIKTVPTAKGSYQTADVAYKNNSFQGKVEGKKVMSFGATKDSFATLAQASPGQTYEVTIVKNDKGYNDWVSMAQAVPGAASPAAPAATGSPGKPAASPRSTYETPEERAQRQVLIVRQSSLSSAAAVLTAGAKVPPSAQAVVALAKEFEAYVFGTEAADMSIEAMSSDDIPVVE